VEPKEVPVEPRKVPVEPEKDPVEPKEVPVEFEKDPVEPKEVPVEPKRIPLHRHRAPPGARHPTVRKRTLVQPPRARKVIGKKVLGKKVIGKKVLGKRVRRPQEPRGAGGSAGTLASTEGLPLSLPGLLLQWGRTRVGELQGGLAGATQPARGVVGGGEAEAPVDPERP